MFPILSIDVVPHSCQSQLTAPAAIQLERLEFPDQSLRALGRFTKGTTTTMTSVVFAQASTKLFYKNIPGYEPPVPEYETYIDENGEEKKREVWPDLLRLIPWLAEWVVCCSREIHPSVCPHETPRY